MSLLLKKLDQASEDEKKEGTPEAEATTAAAPGAAPAPVQGAPAATPPPTPTSPPVAAPAPMAAAPAPGATPAPTPASAPAPMAAAPAPGAAPTSPPASAPAPMAAAAPPPPPPAMNAPAPDAASIREDIPEAPLPHEMGDEDEAGDEDRERKLVSAARVFGASEGESGGGALRAVLALVFVVVLGGGGYFALETSGINVRVLLGLEEPIVVVPPAAPPAVLAAASSEGAALLPRPAIDVQAEIDFAALSLPQAGSTPGLSEEDNRAQLREQIAIITGYGISSEDEDLGLSEEERSLIEQEEAEAAAAERQSLEQLAASLPTDAGASREMRQRIESRTPSDNLLEIVRHNKGEVSEVSEVEVAQAGGGDNAEAGGGEEAAGESESAPAPEVKVDTSKRNEERRKVLNRASKLYASARYAEAEAAYKNVLRDAPANLDALRGVALVATATRRYKLAASSYLKILSYYPKDPFAIAELTSLGSGDLDPFEVERILKDLLGESPAIDGRLYFSLGNVYAGQSRWTEAQKAYFDALANENNPDYAYNLAVTLDYLNKPQLAVRYYKEALHLAKGVANVGFDSGEVESRISALDS